MKKIFLLAGLCAFFPGKGTAGPATPVVRAQLTARNSAVLAAEIGAKIRSLHVLEGREFKKGDLLVSFDDTLQQSQVERAQAVLAGAQRTFAANERLRKLNSVGQIELDLSEAEVSKARAELSYAKAMLAKCQIAAPFAGRVAEQRVHEQEFVQPGQTLIEIIDDAPPEVDFIAPSKWLAWLRIGQSLKVTIDETGHVYSAQVERIGARVDPVSQSIKIVAGVIPASSDLIAGMSGTVDLSPDNPP